MKLWMGLWIAEAVFAGLFITAGHPDSTKRGFVCKMIAGAIFMLNGVWCFLQSVRTDYGVTILVGLAAGLVGDVFLTMDPLIRRRQNPKRSAFYVMLGGIFFLCGHVAYMTAFARLMHAHGAFRLWLFLPAWCGMGLCLALVFRLARVHAGKYLLPVLLYAAGLSAMFALSVTAALFAFSAQRLLQIVLIAAPTLFVLSDSTLALKAADRTRFGGLALRGVSLTAYYLAQMLFGLSILLQG